MCKILAMRILTITLTTLLLLVISGCGQSYNPERDKDCPGCDLVGVQLEGANLSGADLSGANLTRALLTMADLTGANLTGANLFEAALSGVIGLNFAGALNVPDEHLKD